MSDSRNDLPSVNSPNFTQRLRETVQTYLGRQGDPMERGLTLRDLIESGIAKLPSGFKLRPGAGSVPLVPGGAVESAYEIDLTPPPGPTGFTVNAAISNVFIEHDAPLYRVGHGHMRTRVYGVTYQSGPLPVFADAVEIAQFSGTVYAHPTNPSTTWHLWIKWETADGVLSATPAGGTNGLVVRTGEDVSLLLDALTGELNESQLASSLRSRIDLIDGAMPGSVSARISSEAQQRVSADTALSTRIDTVQSSVNGNAAAIQAEASARANADAAEASARETLAARVTTAEGGIATNAAAIQTEASARATAIQAEAAKRETLQATVENNNITLTSAVQTEASTRATETGSLFAKYTVKVDVNGYVAGYGVAATSNDGVPSSEFIVVADKFAIAPVQTDNTANDGSPFFHRTVATTINGVTVPAGTYMKAAYIHDATITNAKIANLAVDDAKIATVSVDKLTAGSIAVGQYIQSTSYIAGQQGWRINGDGSAEFGFADIRGTLLASQIGADTITADKIDARGLVIKDALGNPIIQQGMAIDWSKLGGAAPNLSGLGYSGALDATKGAPAGTYVGSTLAENVESTAGAQAKVSAAQAALQAYTDAETAAAEVRAKAYADGVVTAEETRAIADAQAKADAARVAAINAAALDASSKASAAQTAAQNYAAAQAALAEVSAKAYADGVVDAEEARAIADAQAKADAAKDAAIAVAALDATAKSNAAQTAAQAYAAAQASLAEVTAKAYADGVVDAEEARAIADATAKANAAKDAAISAAAADATTKANNVKATVEAYAAAQAALAETQAKAYADGVVDAEEARAIADAAAKADAARVAAITTAAADATNKANAATFSAIKYTVSATGDTLLPDPQFLSAAAWLGEWDANEASFSDIGASRWTGDYPNSPGVALELRPNGRDNRVGGSRILLELGGTYRVKIRVYRSPTAAGPVWFGVHVPGQFWVSPFHKDGTPPDTGWNLSTIPVDQWVDYEHTFVMGAGWSSHVQTYLRNGLTAGVVWVSMEMTRVIDWSKQITGSGKPEDGATVGAIAGANLKDATGAVISADSIRNNLVIADWWVRDGISPWSPNSEFNRLIKPGDAGVSKGPRTAQDVVWYCENRAGSPYGAGGWDANGVLKLDPTKTYRFVIPFYVFNPSTGGSVYWGTYGVCDLNTANVNGNPYFFSAGRGSFQADRWYLAVGYVFPEGSEGNNHDTAGAWDCLTGQRVGWGTNYCHAPSGAHSHRAYQYYTQINAQTLFGRPMVNLVDGTEPSLREFFESGAVLNNDITVSGGVISGIGTSGIQVDNSYQSIGQNLIPNSDQTQTKCFDGLHNPSNANFLVFNDYASNHWGVDSYTLSGSTTRNLVSRQLGEVVGGPSAVAFDTYPTGGWSRDHGIPVVAGQRYIFSCYMASHRCSFAVGIGFWDAAGNSLSYAISPNMTSAEGPANALQHYARPFVAAVAPAGAVAVTAHIRKNNTSAGGDSYVWYAAPMLEAVAANAQGPSPYMPGPASSTRQLGYAGDLNANNTRVEGGVIQGVSSGAGTPVANSLIGINASGELYGAGAGNGIKISNNQVTLAADGTLNGAGGGKVTLDGMGVHNFRVVSLGLSATSSPNGTGPGLYNATTGAMVVGAGYMYRVVKIRRSDGVVSDVGSWNTLAGGTNPADMAAALNAIGSDHIVVVFTYDEPQGNRLSGGLAEAMYRCGASRAIFGSPNFKYRSAYALIGIPGCGEGNGAEFYQGDVDSSPNSWIDASFSVVKGNLVGVSGSYAPKSLTDYGYTGDLNANYVTNTNQLADGAGLGSTASWSGVSGAGKPADYATNGAPAGTYVGDYPASTVSNAAQGYINQVRSFYVPGNRDTFYPVAITTAVSGGAVLYDFTIFRDSVHENEVWLSAYNCNIRARSHAWGNAPGTIEKVEQRTGNGSYPWGVAAVQPTWGNQRIWVWVRGGMTHHISMSQPIGNYSVDVYENGYSDSFGSIAARTDAPLSTYLNKGYYPDMPDAGLENKLNKAGDAITGPVTFATNGGILAATDANNGVFMGPNGLVGKKAGATTFAIDTAGNASFGGALSAATGSFSGTLDGVSGTFSGTLTADAINAVSTINVAGNAITLPIGATGVAGSLGSGVSGVYVLTSEVTLTENYGIFVAAQCSVDVTQNKPLTGSNSVYGTVSIYRNGVLLDSQKSETVSMSSSSSGSITTVLNAAIIRFDSPGAGTHTYTVRVSRSSTSFTSCSYEVPQLFLMVTKR